MEIYRVTAAFAFINDRRHVKSARHVEDAKTLSMGMLMLVNLGRKLLVMVLTSPSSHFESPSLRVAARLLMTFGSAANDIGLSMLRQSHLQNTNALET